MKADNANSNAAKSTSLLSQLSGLRLSDGTSASDRVARTAAVATSPPTATTMTTTTTYVRPFSTAPLSGTASDRSTPAASPSTRIDDVSRFIAANAIGVSPASEDIVKSTTTPATASAAKKGSAPSDIVANLALRLNNNNTNNNNNASSPVVVNATSSSGGSKNNNNSNKHKDAAAKTNGPSSVSVPKPRSGNVATTTTVVASPTAGAPIDPKVMEFISKQSKDGPIPMADEKALRTVVVKTAAAAAAPAAAKGMKGTDNNNNYNTNSSSSPSAHEHSKAIAANRFLVESLGGGVIDNMNVSEPVIRKAPPVPSGGRYIVVGDVHGCVDQLTALIDKIGYTKGKDCLIMIGDYVNKGPDSIGVIRACQEWGALGVLGNHDWTLLNMCARMRRKAFTAEDLRDPVKRLAAQLPLSCEQYLRMLPHIIRIPRYNVLLVHAGLNVQHSIEKQNIHELMHLRKLNKVSVPDPKGRQPDVTKYEAVTDGKSHLGVPWASVWDGPEHVIFGHDAYTGFQSHPFACGIDTGCVYGDPLTCVVYSEESPEGEYHRVPGLPQMTNELMGLPPPDSDIYEQSQSTIDQMIIRPTTRSTPSVMSPSRPVFATTPTTYASPSAGASSAAAQPASGIIAFPSQAAVKTPLTVVNARTHQVADASAWEVQKATLLALSASKELSAIGVLLGIPSYEQMLDEMQSVDVTQKTAQQSFWVPFVRCILQSATARSAAADATAEDALQYALTLCDEMPMVRQAVKAELLGLQSADSVEDVWSRTVVKYLGLVCKQ